MKTENTREQIRPVKLALIFTVTGEAAYFLVWGLWLFPNGSVFGKLAWTTTCAVAMAVMIGVAVITLVLDHLDGFAALVSSAILYILVLSICTLICYAIDNRFDYFGGASAPTLFVLAGIIPATLSAIPFAWLLFTPKGKWTLDQLGL